MIKVWSCDKWSGGVNGKQHILLDLRSSFIHNFGSPDLVDWIDFLLLQLPTTKIRNDRPH